MYIRFVEKKRDQKYKILLNVNGIWTESVN